MGRMQPGAGRRGSAPGDRKDDTQGGGGMAGVGWVSSPGGKVWRWGLSPSSCSSGGPPCREGHQASQKRQPPRPTFLGAPLLASWGKNLGKIREGQIQSCPQAGARGSEAEQGRGSGQTQPAGRPGAAETRPTGRGWGGGLSCTHSFACSPLAGFSLCPRVVVARWAWVLIPLLTGHTGLGPTKMGSF